MVARSCLVNRGGMPPPRQTLNAARGPNCDWLPTQRRHAGTSPANNTSHLVGKDRTKLDWLVCWFSSVPKWKNHLVWSNQTWRNSTTECKRSKNESSSCLSRLPAATGKDKTKLDSCRALSFHSHVASCWCTFSSSLSSGSRPTCRGVLLGHPWRNSASPRQPKNATMESCLDCWMGSGGVFSEA